MRLRFRRTARLAPIFAWALLPRTVVTALVITGAIFTALFVARTVLAGAIIPRTVFAALLVARTVFTGTVVTGPIITALVAVAVAIIAAIVIAARLLALRAGLGQLNQRAFILVADDVKTFGRRLHITGLFAAVVIPLAIAVAIAILLMELLAGLLFSSLFAHRFGQKPGVMLGMLQEILCRHPVIRQLGVAGQKLILLDDLLRRTAHLALGAGAVEHPVDDIAEGTRAVLLGTRAGLGRAHLDL